MKTDVYAERSNGRDLLIYTHVVHASFGPFANLRALCLRGKGPSDDDCPLRLTKCSVMSTAIIRCGGLCVNVMLFSCMYIQTINLYITPMLIQA